MTLVCVRSLMCVRERRNCDEYVPVTTSCPRHFSLARPVINAHRHRESRRLALPVHIESAYPPTEIVSFVPSATPAPPPKSLRYRAERAPSLRPRAASPAFLVRPDPSVRPRMDLKMLRVPPEVFRSSERRVVRSARPGKCARRPIRPFSWTANQAPTPKVSTICAFR